MVSHEMAVRRPLSVHPGLDPGYVRNRGIARLPQAGKTVPLTDKDAIGSPDLLALGHCLIWMKDIGRNQPVLLHCAALEPDRRICTSYTFSISSP
jgi:hypothetical protein